MPSRATIQLRPRHGVIDIDGQDISHVVRSIAVHHDAGGDVPVVVVELAITDLTKVEADSPSVEVGDETRAALVALGWTPPDSEDEETREEATPDRVEKEDVPPPAEEPKDGEDG